MGNLLTSELFDSLKTGMVVAVTWRSCMSSRTKPLLLRVGRRSWSKKHQTATLALDNLNGSKGREMNRVRLYKRADGQVYEALGDLAVTFTSFAVVPEPTDAVEEQC